MKNQLNNFGKLFYIVLSIIAVITILNFFSFGFIFAFAFGLSGGMQVILCFACLLVGSVSWATIETIDEIFTF